MRRMRSAYGWRRLAALALALTLALLLAGCSSPEGSPDETESEPEETTGSRSGDRTDAPEQADASGSESGDRSGSAASSGDPPMTAEEEVLARRTGLTDDEFIDITGETAKQIHGAVAGMQAAYAAGPGGKDPLVTERDWSVYTSPLGVVNLSRREAAFYDLLDKLGQAYISTSGLDGVKYVYSSGTYYAADGVQFSSLGLSYEQACAVYRWFRYNHPQYYFFSNAVLSTSDSLYPCLYDNMADGEDRAEITNELFEKLEDWVRDVESRAATTYTKELYANNLICEENSYEKQYVGPLRVDQSLYSSVLLGKTVCAGYSMAFSAMMNAMGVDTTAGLSAGHAWNVVCFDDGNYYAVDVCWNDTDSGSVPYDNRYLNVGDAESKARDGSRESHTYEETYSAWIPAITADSYVVKDSDVAGPSFVPAAPSNIHVTSTGEDTAAITWDPVEGASGYQVCLYKDSAYSEIGTTVNCATEATLSQIRNTLYIGVRAVMNVNGEDVCSDWVNFSYTHTGNS